MEPTSAQKPESIQKSQPITPVDHSFDASESELGATAGMPLFLQRSRISVQPKLTVGESGDVYEQEADRMADQVMAISQSDRLIQEREPKKEQSKIQMKSSLASDENLATSGIEGQLDSSKGGGSPLPDDVRSFMEPRFGSDFSQVRVHTSSESVQMNQDLNAQAFTHKHDIYFGAGKTPAKDALTAHELTHIAQQTSPVQHPLIQLKPDPQSSFQTFIESKVAHIHENIENTDVQDPDNNPFHQLNGLWIRDMVNVLKTLDRSGDLDTLLQNFRSAPSYTKPRIGFVINTIKPFPEGAKAAEDFEKSQSTGSAADQATLQQGQQEFKGQKAEVTAFQSARNWTTLLPPKATPPIPQEQQQVIIDSIMRERDLVKENSGLFKKGSGYEYDGTPGTDPAPNLSDSNPRRAEINRIVWQELAGEGSSASINTYDSALLTWGRGFAGQGGQLGQKMEILFTRDADLKNQLMAAGFTYEGGKWMAVNTDTQRIEEGAKALKLIQTNKRVLSLLIQLGEDPKHRQNVVDAEFGTVRQNAGAVPAWANTWSNEAIRFTAHCVHWGSSWSLYSGTGGDIKKITQIMAPRVAREPDRGGAILTKPPSTNTFRGFAGGALNGLLTGPAPLPGDIDTVSYAGHIFLATSGSNYYHLTP